MPEDIVIGRDESDKKRFGNEGLVYLGKHYIKMGSITSLSNRIMLDVARAHVVLVAGKRGSGKCITGDTLIPLTDGSVMPIEKLANDSRNIFGLNEEFKINSLRKSDFFDREVDKILHIKLRSGREIKLTPEHPLLTIKGWKPAKELGISSRIATERKIECFGKEEMPEHEIKLLAYLIAEGHLGNGFVLFTNSDEAIVKDYFNCISSFDKSLIIKSHGKYCYRTVQERKKIKEHVINRDKIGRFDKGSGIRYEKSSLRLWFEKLDLYGKSSLKKFIPQEIFKLPKEQLSLFLNRLFSCDGSVYFSKNHWEISYSSSSEKLIRQVQHLLLRFGVLSKLRKKQVKCNSKLFETFELNIESENIKRFIEEIGFYGIKKEKENLALEWIKSRIQNPNVDTIPKEIWETYKPKNWAAIGRACGYKYPKAMREKIKYCPSRQTLLQIAEVEQNNPLQLLATSDIFWDEIVSIELIEGKIKVYDLSVPDYHNFVANDIIVHNSYTLGTIAEEIATLPPEVAQNIAVLLFDTMGIFWTMKYKNDKEIEMLREWGLETRKIPVKVFVPFGKIKDYDSKGIPYDQEFSLSVPELSADDWVITFGLDYINPVAIVIERNVTMLQEELEAGTIKNFDIDDIILTFKKDKDSSKDAKDAAINFFEGAKTWGLFASKKQKGTKVNELVEAGKTTVLDVSCYSSIGTFNIRSLVIGLLSKKLFNERMDARKKEEVEAVRHGIDYLYYKEKREMPLVWLAIDECLVGNTEIITDKAHTPIQDIVNKFETEEKFKVLGFDNENKKYDYFDVNNVYKKGKRKIIKLITETGREIICTPEHRVLTDNGFASAFSVDNIAFPLFQHYSQNKKLIEARILGHLFGDGWVSDKTKTLGFSGKGNRGDLEKIRKDLFELGFTSSNISERKTSSKINHQGKITEVYGTSQSFTSSSKAHKYFREKAGFAGEKVFSSTKILGYILNSSDLEKAEFLAALMGSDGQVITSAKNAKGDFNAIRITFNKIENLEKEAFEYANQIKKLFEDLEIKISNISKKEGNLRKDGHKTIKVIITLEKNIENTIKFLEKIGYRYCYTKEIEGLKWLEYLKARLFLKKEREKVKEKALNLHSSGLGKVKISRQLRFPEAQVRDWIYNDISPGLPKSFLNIDMWIKNRQKEGILFERVFKIDDMGEEEVYDISVDKVHNFVSNGLITHNCHEFLPKEGKTSATDALIQLLREGRQPGISLLLATQQPGMIHRDVLTQSDVVIAHRVTAKPDIDALNYIMQTYLLADIKTYLDNLPRLKGSAIILDDNSERIYPIRVRPRFTWHGGEAPTAIKVKKRI